MLYNECGDAYLQFFFEIAVGIPGFADDKCYL